MLYNILNINILNFNTYIDIFIILALITALKVITVHNPMYSILYLILLFINISIYLYYIGLGIMSLLYLLIYIGAIAILFLFILSLLDIKITELHIENNINDIPITIIVTISLYYFIYNIYNNIYNIAIPKTISNYYNNTNIDYFFTDYNINLINNWHSISQISELSSIGTILYSEYAIILIIISIILLLCIIGAIVLSISNNRN